MCDSPQSLPRAPSCDSGAVALGEGPGGSIAGAASALIPPLFSHRPFRPPPLYFATLAFKALDIRDPEPFPCEVRA